MEHNTTTHCWGEDIIRDLLINYCNIFWSEVVVEGGPCTQNDGATGRIPPTTTMLELSLCIITPVSIPFTMRVMVLWNVAPRVSTTTHLNCRPSSSGPGWRLSTSSFVLLADVCIGIRGPSTSNHWMVAALFWPLKTHVRSCWSPLMSIVSPMMVICDSAKIQNCFKTVYSYTASYLIIATYVRLFAGCESSPPATRREMANPKHFTMALLSATGTL